MSIFLAAIVSAALGRGDLYCRFQTPPPAKEDPAVLAGRAKEIFRAHCLECHGGGAKVSAGVKILDRERLVKDERLAPGKPDDSTLFQLMTASDDSVMPPKSQPRVNPEDVEAIRKWIAAGAPDFPKDAAKPPAEKKDAAAPAGVGAEYIHGKILAHVRTLKPEDRRYTRYFSINHLLAGGATAGELELHRQALAKAINHLSWETSLVPPQPIDGPANSVFAVDIRKLGWQLAPYEYFERGRSTGKSTVNIYDLALLEYPYAILPKDSETFDRLTEEYLAPAGMVRPIPYIRADWFASTVTQPPLYEDFLQLPFFLQELEAKLGVDSAANIRDGVAQRAGMTVSGVSRNNRVVERHSPRGFGFYWKSFDFKSNRGPENMFKDPIDFKESGGEMIFGLPNGLQAYYVADARGNRLEEAPTAIVTDKFAEDKTVRNGLACMRCHDSGMKSFDDSVRPALLNLPGVAGFDKREALKLYPGDDAMKAFLKKDGNRFTAAMKELLGQPQKQEPLIPVTRRYLENPLQLSAAAGELGLADASGLQAVFRSPQFAALGLLPLAGDGIVRRDAWEEYFDQAVRGLGIGVPVVPLDGLIRRDYGSGTANIDVELKTNKKNNIFEPGDTMSIAVTNKSDRALYIELIGTSALGKKVILVEPTTRLEPGQVYRFPGEGKAIKIKGGLGKEQITLFASDAEFPCGQILRGKDVSDRVIHRFQALQPRPDGTTAIVGDPARVVKKTLEVETR